MNERGKKEPGTRPAGRVLILAAAVLALMLTGLLCFPRIAKTPGFNSTPTAAAPAMAMQSPVPSANPSATPQGPVAAPDPSPTPAKGPGGPMVRPVYDDTDRTQYDIRLRYEEKDHTATATQTIRYTNTSTDSMGELYLHIYPNHFSKREYVEMYFNTRSRPVYPGNKFNPGSITLSNIKAAGQDAPYTIQGEDSTILRIPLAAPLLRGQGIELHMAYSLQLPHRMGRFGWGDTAASFANWYPILAVYDDEGWNLDPYYEIGDPFYSETADYEVTIDMPGGMEAAFTGDVSGDTTTNGRRTLSLFETGVRDFAFALSRKYAIQTQTVDGIEVRVAMPKADRAMMGQVMEDAAKSLSIYNRKFGKYTNDALTVAFVDNYGGMEYPGIVFIQDTLLNTQKNGTLLTTIVVHEIGHQWWYSAVGNDEVDQPWLDESLTSFTEMVYRSGGKKMATGRPNIDIKPSSTLEKGIDKYRDWSSYRYIYSFGREFFMELMEVMGEERFYTMLQKYYNNYAYGIATTEDLRALVMEMGNDEAVKWFDLCVYGKEVSG